MTELTEWANEQYDIWVEQLHELIEQDVESCQPRHQLSTMIQREFGGDNDV